MFEDDDIVNWFVVAWCNEGLECVLPITEMEKQNTFNILSGLPTRTKPMHNVNMLILRAKYNMQRHYEIYAVSAGDEISKKDLEQLFKNDPQSAADLIRDRGQQIYSDRVQPSNIVIS